jgi:hypothetical protein
MVCARARSRADAATAHLAEHFNLYFLILDK